MIKKRKKRRVYFLLRSFSPSQILLRFFYYKSFLDPSHFKLMKKLHFLLRSLSFFKIYISFLDPSHFQKNLHFLLRSFSFSKNVSQYLIPATKGLITTYSHGQNLHTIAYFRSKFSFFLKCVVHGKSSATTLVYLNSIRG